MEKIPFHLLIVPLTLSAACLFWVGYVVGHVPAEKPAVLHIADSLNNVVNCAPNKDVPNIYECHLTITFLKSDLIDTPQAADPPEVIVTPKKTHIAYTF